MAIARNVGLHRKVNYFNKYKKKCKEFSFFLIENRKILPKMDDITEKSIIGNNIEESDDVTDPLIKTSDENGCNGDGDVNTNSIGGCAVRQRLVIYTAETLHLVVFGASLAGLLLGFIAGYFVSRRFHSPPPYPDAPFIEQHNHLER